MDAKVSVVLPTYNRSERLVKAVDSVLAQSYRNFELLIIDDGSTDNTKEVVDNINDDRIKYYYKENGGFASARNFGLKKVTGDYIAFLDSDDYYMADKLKKQVECLEANQDFDVCYANYLIVNDLGNNMKKRSIDYYDMPKGLVIKEILRGRIALEAWNLLVRKKCFEEMPPFDETMEKWIGMEVVYRLAYKYKFYPIKEFLYGHVQHEDGRMTDFNIDRYTRNLKKLVKGFEEKSGCTDRNIIRIIRARGYFDSAKAYLRQDKSIAGFYKNMVLAFYNDPLNAKIFKFLINPNRVLKTLRKKY